MDGGSTNPKTNDSQPIASPTENVDVPSDMTSREGKFSWETVEFIHLPILLRGSEKYMPVRMIGMKLIDKYIDSLNSEVYANNRVPAYFMTHNEARLLTEINHKHLESPIGRKKFTEADLVARFDDIMEFYNFVHFCSVKISNIEDPKRNKCGFVKIGEKVITYLRRENDKFVPILFFGNILDTLREECLTVGGWDYAYLKFHCNLIGIKMSKAFDSIQVIDIVKVLHYLQIDAEIQEYWPSSIADVNIFVKENTGFNVPWFTIESTEFQILNMDNKTEANADVTAIDTFDSTEIEYILVEDMSSNETETISFTCSSCAPGSKKRKSAEIITEPIPKSHQLLQDKPEQEFQVSESTMNRAIHSSSSKEYQALSNINEKHLSLPGPSKAPDQITAVENVICFETNSQNVLPDCRRGNDSFTPLSKKPVYKIWKFLLDGKSVIGINTYPYFYSEIFIAVYDLIENFFPMISLQKCCEIFQNDLKIPIYPSTSGQTKLWQLHKKVKISKSSIPLVRLKNIVNHISEIKDEMKRHEK